MFMNFLMLIPLLLFSLDVIGKMIVGHDIKATGADLCMFAISFHFTTVIIDQVGSVALLEGSVDSFVTLNTVAHALALICVIFWLLSLFVTGEKMQLILSDKSSIGPWIGPSVGFLLGVASVFTVTFMLNQIAKMIIEAGMS